MSEIIIRPYVWKNSRKPFPAIDIIRPEKDYPECRFYEGFFGTEEEAMNIAIDMATIEANRIGAIVELPDSEIER